MFYGKIKSAYGQNIEGHNLERHWLERLLIERNKLESEIIQKDTKLEQDISYKLEWKESQHNISQKVERHKLECDTNQK